VPEWAARPTPFVIEHGHLAGDAQKAVVGVEKAQFRHVVGLQLSDFRGVFMGTGPNFETIRMQASHGSHPGNPVVDCGHEEDVAVLDDRLSFVS